MIFCTAVIWPVTIWRDVNMQREDTKRYAIRMKNERVVIQTKATEYLANAMNYAADEMSKTNARLKEER